MRITIAFFTLTLSFQVVAGEIADAIGVYLPNEKNECGSTVFYGGRHMDRNITGVCVPISVLLDDEKKEFLYLAITELKNPEDLPQAIEHHLSKERPTEAYEVEIDDYDNDIFELVDGAILEKSGYGYVGYIGYREDGILYKDRSQWHLCVDGDNYEVKVLKNGSKYHYSRDKLRGKSVRDIETMSICQ